MADLMLVSAEKLAGAGADFLIAPANTIHQAFPLVEPRSPLPWLHVAVEVAHEPKRRGFRRLGILGSAALMDGPVYRDTLEAAGIEHRIPAADARRRIDGIIFDELVNSPFLASSLEHVAAMIAALGDQCCDAVALACTELSLLLSPASSPLPTLDSTRILARAALRRAAAG